MLQRYWDGWQRDQVPIVVAVAGSALSFMEGMLGEDSPLYGRATYRPLLAPLDYRQASGFTSRIDHEQLIRRFAVLGGTPQYQAWAGDTPLVRVISERILAPGRPLYDDPLHLLRTGEGVRSPGNFLSVLWAVARGETRFGDIANRTGLRSPTLAERLGRLQELDYLGFREPSDPKDQPRRGRYEIADPYFRFWFRYVFPNRSRLELGRVDEVASEIKSDFDTYLGPVFEACCRTWIGRYAPRDLTGPLDQLGSWWSRDGTVEVDIAAHHNGRFTLLGSVEWSATVGTRVLDQLEAARDLLGTRAARARLALFARQGFTPDVRERASQDGVILVTASELFER